MWMIGFTPSRGVRGRFSPPFPPASHESERDPVRGDANLCPMSASPDDRRPRLRHGGVGTMLSLTVAVVLGDAGIVTLALPDILREFGARVGEVAWVLIAFNLVLALAAVPAARLCVRGNPASATAAGLVVFGVATAACAAAPSLAALVTARAFQAVGGALVLVGSLELLIAAAGDELAGARRWAVAGVAGTALGPVAGGLLTAAFAWRSIFIVQIPVAILAIPAALALRHRTVSQTSISLDTTPDRPHVLANLALALLSAGLAAALFLLVLLIVDGWRKSPAVAAVAVTAIPLAALAAGPLFRTWRAGTRSEAIAGSILVAGGLAGLALLPAASLPWTLAPQLLVGLGLGLSVDSLTSAALRDRVPRALHGGWTIAARHAGVVLGLAILTPIFTADLRRAETPAKEAVAGLVLDAPLPATTKLELAGTLSRRLVAERGRVPDLRPAFASLRLAPGEVAPAAALEADLEDQLRRAATRAFRTAFLVAALIGLLALAPAAALRDRSRGVLSADDPAVASRGRSGP
jgi:MFS family permease